MATSQQPAIQSPRYYVIQRIRGKIVPTRFVGENARKAALIYFDSVDALKVEVNYGKGPARIR